MAIIITETPYKEFSVTLAKRDFRHYIDEVDEVECKDCGYLYRDERGVCGDCGSDNLIITTINEGCHCQICNRTFDAFENSWEAEYEVNEKYTYAVTICEECYEDLED